MTRIIVKKKCPFAAYRTCLCGNYVHHIAHSWPSQGIILASSYRIMSTVVILVRNKSVKITNPLLQCRDPVQIWYTENSILYNLSHTDGI